MRRWILLKVLQNDDTLPQRSFSLRNLAPHCHIPGKGPSEGRGILVQNQQDPSAQLDGTIERRLTGVVANLILQLMLVVGVGAHPVGRLIRQLTQGSVALQARHELAHRLQPSVGHKPQELIHLFRAWSCEISGKLLSS